jgi:hypothetical protein
VVIYIEVQYIGIRSRLHLLPKEAEAFMPWTSAVHFVWIHHTTSQASQLKSLKLNDPIELIMMYHSGLITTRPDMSGDHAVIEQVLKYSTSASQNPR